ncbi:hypothetical protein [Aquimarina algiphila]|uniref:Uncharacterized protein n=1 Tax=Aquimarina algiphila TaxID=2047982 RepID=A0A554VG25_9FLAO|nr:hypothetical protein [Aquimarina algiphila]TSE06289.1 hypothetical protein FOF46_20095 [Aquimarina algiphila]
MSNENYSDEIDMMQIFSMIKGGFRNFLRLIISVITFYKKKAILFLVLLILGGIAGYFLEQRKDAKFDIVQEIIIEPKYNSTKYIYDFIDELKINLRDDVFVDKLGITVDNAKNIKNIKIEPIIKGTDVLDNLEKRYENREFFKDIMNAYDEDQIEEEKFRDFYKHHKISIEFNSVSVENEKLVSSILKYIKSNQYYRDVSNLFIKQNKIDLERNKTSLEFIDTYLENIKKTPLKVEREAVVLYSPSQEIPMLSVASLLQKKELLMELINEQEQALVLDKEIFSFVDYGDVISRKKKMVNNMLFTVPVLFFLLVSLFFFLKYLSRTIKNFVEEEE